MSQTNRAPIDPKEERHATRLRQGFDGQANDEPTKHRIREKKRVEVTGSRWVGVALLLLTALLSFVFSFQGKGVTVQFGDVVSRISNVFFGSSTMTFEK